MPEPLLVRHAATAWSGRRYCGRSDPPLSPGGIAGATRLAAQLRVAFPRSIRIVTSPRRRAVETAQAIAAMAEEASIQFDDRWAETDFGIAEGLTFDELMNVAPDIAARLAAGAVDIDWPGGERAADLVTRVKSAWRDVTADGPPDLVVTHGGPIRVAIALATGTPAKGIAIPEPGGLWHPGDGRGTPPGGRRNEVPLLRFPA